MQKLRPPIPEALDKLSILILKLDRLPNDQGREAVQREHAFYTAVIHSYLQDDFTVYEEWLDMLIEINGRCWDLEAAIRQGKDANLGLEEIGRRSLKIREVNKERIAYKNKIAEELGMDFFEVKIDHASE